MTLGAEPILLAGVALAAYHGTYSPAVRVGAVCKTLGDANQLNDSTIEVMATLPESPGSEDDLAEACDNKDALFIATVNAKHVQSAIEGSGFFQRHVIPTFTCERGGRKLRLKDLEREAKTYRQDVLATSLKAKERKEKEKVQGRGGSRTPAQQPAQQPPQQNQFTQPTQSFNIDLERGLPLL